MKLKVLDLFSGIGGLSLGLESTGGFETIHFCELNSYCRKVLKKHWPSVPITKDIRFLTKSFLKDLGRIDLICGGFPCQDISVANIGGEGLDGIDSGLWIEFRRIIKEVIPEWIVIENVANLKGKGFATILQNLNELRYDVSWHNISATAVGRPHQRERIFIVAKSQCIRCTEGADQEYKTDSPDFFGDPNKQSVPLANTTGEGLERPIGRSSKGNRPSIQSRTFPEWSPQGDYERAVESAIFRVAYGVSQRLDEIKMTIEETPSDEILPKLVSKCPDRKERVQSLGNSVVPAIISIIGEAILNERGADAPDSLF